MKHFASPSFWEQYEKLPKSIQGLADKNFDLLKADSKHPSLHLKKTGKHWSVRVGIKYRALGIEIDEGMLRFWIGTHADYDQMIEE